MDKSIECGTSALTEPGGDCNGEGVVEKHHSSQLFELVAHQRHWILVSAQLELEEELREQHEEHDEAQHLHEDGLFQVVATQGQEQQRGQQEAQGQYQPTGMVEGGAVFQHGVDGIGGGLHFTGTHGAFYAEVR